MIEFNDKAPLYEQLYRHFIYEIQAGRIKKGARLPSKRQLAESFGVSLSTVENAYQQLLSEGFIFSMPRSGFFVEQRLPAFPIKYAPENREINQAQESLDIFSLSRSQRSLFPSKTLLRKYRLALEDEELLLQKGSSLGDRELRELIAKFIYDSKGISCSWEQIVIASGTELLLSSLMLMLKGFNSIYIENPGYKSVYSIANMLGREILPLSLDENGIRTEELGQRGLCFVTPRHQFPLAVSLSRERRKRLLLWADRTKSFIIEDDYDSEFKYNSRPLQSLFSASNKVIYMSGISKTISPSLRFAYMVLPKSLQGAYEEMFSQSSCSVSRLEQRMLSLLIADGSYSRHIRRAARANRLKLAKLLKMLREEIPFAAVRGYERGLHFALKIAAPKEQVKKEAERLNIRLNFSSDFLYKSGEKALNNENELKKISNLNSKSGANRKIYENIENNCCLGGDSQNSCELLIGFACLEQEELSRAVKVLAEILKNAKKNS